MCHSDMAMMKSAVFPTMRTRDRARRGARKNSLCSGRPREEEERHRGPSVPGLGHEVDRFEPVSFGGYAIELRLDLLVMDVGDLDDLVTSSRMFRHARHSARTFAASLAAYVRIRSAPARLIDTRISIINRPPSTHPSCSPAFTIEYSPLTL